MSIIIHDFEVFKYDVLLGVIVVNETGEKLIQFWGEKNILEFYNSHTHDLWVGHNNLEYDELILEAIVNGKDAYKTSKSIIGSKFRQRCHLPISVYDTMVSTKYSLKMTEFAVGKNISETQVDFDLDRPLTEEEIKLTESYNKDDLEQTLYNFKQIYSEFSLRLNLIQEFKLPMSALNITGTKLASTVLGAKAVSGIDKMIVPTVLPKTIQIKNKEVIDFYLNEDFRKNKRIKVMLCGAEHTVASGGIHAALKKIHVDKALYFDVSGYYNLIMLNYQLLPRTMPKESKELYDFMYHEQLRLKGIDNNKRVMYKTILLSVFGAMMNKYTDFYDPWHGSLVTITGEIFLVDLLEKLEGYVKVLQSNTDGIMVEPFDWSQKNEIIKIVEEWENRTGFVIKKEEIHNLWQRDVNNYVYDDNGNPHVKGEAVRAYTKMANPVWYRSWETKEAPIVSYGIVDYLLYGITPEETVEKHKRELTLYQYACRPISFDYCQYEEKNVIDGKETKTKLQNINRAFASNDTDIVSTVVKYKQTDDGTIKKSKISNLPKRIFIHNSEILSNSAIDKLIQKIDYSYYINRIWERLGEFI